MESGIPGEAITGGQEVNESEVPLGSSRGRFWAYLGGRFSGTWKTDHMEGGV